MVRNGLADPARCDCRRGGFGDRRGWFVSYQVISNVTELRPDKDFMSEEPESPHFGTKAQAMRFVQRMRRIRFNADDNTRAVERVDVLAMELSGEHRAGRAARINITVDFESD